MVSEKSKKDPFALRLNMYGKMSLLQCNLDTQVELCLRSIFNMNSFSVNR